VTEAEALSSSGKLAHDVGCSGEVWFASVWDVGLDDGGGGGVGGGVDAEHLVVVEEAAFFGEGGACFEGEVGFCEGCGDC